jgi:hypothetical protein
MEALVVVEIVATVALLLGHFGIVVWNRMARSA